MADKSDKGKKRKRQRDENLKPSKKVAIEGDKNIRISHHEADKWAPVLALIPGITIPTSLSLQPFTKPRANSPLTPGPSRAIAMTELLLHSSAHPKLDYVAREEDSGGADTLLKHYVGLYDPASGDLEIIEARKMVARGTVRAQQANGEDEVSTNVTELRNNLGQTFGTKKARKAIAAATENAISPDKAARILANGDKPAKLDAVSAAMIAAMAESTAGMSTRDQLAVVADAAKPRPRANVNATKIQNVYTLDSLVGLGVIEHVPVWEWQDAVRSKQEVHVKSRFVARRIQRVASSVEKLRILRYLLCLLDLRRASKSMRGGAKTLPKNNKLRASLGNMPDVVVDSIKRKFTEGGLMSRFKLDLLITHVCALACLVDNYEVDMWDLKEDLQLESKEISQYFHEIGAKIGELPEADRKSLGLDKAAAALHKVARLKLPLDFPKAPYPRRADKYLMSKTVTRGPTLP